jgi:heterodisulfide reductase subunit C
VGLDLDDLWEAGRSDLAAAGQPAPAGWVGARSALEWEEALVARAGSVAAKPPAWRAGPLSGDRGTFSRCVQCQTCTNVCPVVAAGMVGDGPDLTPQKVMNLLRLGLEDLAIGSGMVWRCATCYQCQEHCPEGIRVTDVMLELRGLGYRRLGSARDGGGKA